MLRLLGGTLLLLGALWLGRDSSACLRERLNALRSWIDALELLRADIAAFTPLPEALLHAGRIGGCSGSFMESVVVSMEQENRILEAIWREAMRDQPLRACELDSLSILGAQLGRYDVPTQLRALERCVCDFERWEREATDKTRKEAGLRLRLMGAAGALLLIVLW